MTTFGDALTRKIGPAPVWVYGVGLGLGISGFRYWRSRSAPASVTADEVSDGTEAPADGAGAPASEYTPGVAGAYPIPGNYQMNPGGVLTPAPDAPGGTGPVAARDNFAWQQEAYDALVGRRGYAALAVSEALKKYLNGDPITAQEEAIVSAALREVGNPPDGAPSIVRAAPAPVAAPAGGGPSSTPAGTGSAAGAGAGAAAGAAGAGAGAATLPPGYTPGPRGVPLYNGKEGASPKDPLAWAFIRASQDYPNESPQQWYARAKAARGE